ncbi:MAG: hypothetical protein SCARUB_03111, partial [Candidatus Scalindua rubra]
YLKFVATCVAATFRLRNLREIFTYPSDDEKRRLKPAATVIYNIKSLKLGSIIVLKTVFVVNPEYLTLKERFNLQAKQSVGQARLNDCPPE